jgi:hypothetical protein
MKRYELFTLSIQSPRTPQQPHVISLTIFIKV